jgi:hypothetical protein
LLGSPYRPHNQSNIVCTLLNSLAVHKHTHANMFPKNNPT